MNQPHNAVPFMTPGAYGSTFMDSITGREALQIAICDQHFRDAPAGRYRFMVYRNEEWHPCESPELA